MSSTSAWLDLARRPQRRYLLGLQRSAGPHRQSPSVAAHLHHHLCAQWAAKLGVAPSTVLPCASRTNALRLVANAVLLPGDRVRLAQPGLLAWAAAVLSAGAQFVDLGRIRDGCVDPATLAASPAARLAILGAPAPTGAFDARGWSTVEGELRLADATLADSLVGRLEADADVTLVALRDPDRPAAPVLTALVGAPEDIAALRFLAGPETLPTGLLRAAVSALQRVDDGATAALGASLSARAAELQAGLPLSPGQRWLPRAGVTRAVRCLAADGAPLVALGQQLGFSGAAWSGHPGGGLVRFELLP